VQLGAFHYTNEAALRFFVSPVFADTGYEFVDSKTRGLLTHSRGMGCHGCYAQVIAPNGILTGSSDNTAKLRLSFLFL
jgi:hypothetical protein